MSTEFVTLTHDNIALVTGLYTSVFNSPPWNDGWSDEAALERLRSFAAIPTFRGLILCLDGTPKALALGWGERWVKGWVFHLKEMCVCSTLQRSGLGGQLLSEFEARLSAENFTGVYLQTGESVPARAFYESVGYERFAIVSLRKRFPA